MIELTITTNADSEITQALELHYELMQFLRDNINENDFVEFLNVLKTVIIVDD